MVFAGDPKLLGFHRFCCLGFHLGGRVRVIFALNLSPVPLLGYGGSGADNGMRIMTGQSTETPREYFMLDAERELIAFETKERELRKQERRERVEQKFPNLIKELQS